MDFKKAHFTPKWGYIPLSKYKTFEYQFEGSKFMRDDIFEFRLRWNRKTDHAGIEFTFGIHKLFWIHIDVHDNRHWDYDNDCWMKYGTDIKQSSE